MVPPGNWWDILSVVGACAKAREPAERDGNGGDGTCDEAPARDVHGFLLGECSDETGAPAWDDAIAVYTKRYSV